MSILRMENVSYKYSDTGRNVLDSINVEFDKGRMYGIVGKSGAGKTTMLSLLSGMEKCTEGCIFYDDEDISQIDCDEYRARRVGVVFQSHNLIQNASGIENLMIAMSVTGKKGKKARDEAYAILSGMGIDKDTADSRVMNMSGGEQQRVAIARAICNNPDVLIADEPTSSLDADTTNVVMDILGDLARNNDKCVIVVSHSKDVVERTDEIWGLTGGRPLCIE